MMPNKTASRIAYLDGLRGVAILMVLLVHAYAGYPTIYPYGARFSRNLFFAYGWLGVHLFFLISGFVILMTLEKCRRFQEFLLRRWLRLFPAMMICSSLVFVTARFFPERPGGAPLWRDMLPGLTFMEPSWWRVLLGSPQGILEAAFWSLFVEVKFYVVFGLLYFWVGWKKAVSALIFLFAFSVVHASWKPSEPSVLRHVVHYLGHLEIALNAQYFGWFAAGALLFRYSLTRERASLLCAITVVAASAADSRSGWGASLAALAVGLFFTMSVVHPGPKRILEQPGFLFMGFISYPLYLLHENMLLAMIIRMGRAAPWLPAIMIPLLPMAVVIGLAWPIAAWLEPRARDLIHPTN